MEIWFTVVVTIFHLYYVLLVMRGTLLACMMVMVVTSALRTSPSLSITTTIYPPYRASTLINPVISVLVNGIQEPLERVHVTVRVSDVLMVLTNWTAVPNVPFDVSFPAGSNVIHPGIHNVDIDVMVPNIDEILHDSHEYHIVRSEMTATGLIDGAFIDIYHWSDSEAKMFNAALKNMTNSDWIDQMQYMSTVGIRTGIIQNMFLSYQYVRQGNQTCDKYYGKAFFPSVVYPSKFEYFNDNGDKLEAILTGADRYGITMFVGVGLYAWFDYTPDSLCWHLRVLAELHSKYGHHPSLAGFYVSEEMFGDFYDSTPNFYYQNGVRDVIDFFTAFKSAVRRLNPLYKVMFAPNSQYFDREKSNWAKVLVNVDIAMPFGFARDASFQTLQVIHDVCASTGTRVWVDMELFAFPIGSDGLVPKPINSIIGEINKLYPSVENVVGYEFTGLMNSAESKQNLGGRAAIKMYDDYLKYYHDHIKL